MLDAIVSDKSAPYVFFFKSEGRTFSVLNESFSDTDRRQTDLNTTMYNINKNI